MFRDSHKLLQIIRTTAKEDPRNKFQPTTYSTPNETILYHQMNVNVFLVIKIGAVSMNSVFNQSSSMR